MKRKGIILLETVLYILLLSLLAAAVLPFVGQTARLISLFQIRGRMTEQSLFAVDFMTEKLRNHLECTETVYACLLYTSPSPRDLSTSRMPSSA